MSITVNSQFSKTDLNQSQKNSNKNLIQSKNLHKSLNDKFVSNHITKKEKPAVSFAGRGTNILKSIINILKNEANTGKKTLVKETKQGVNSLEGVRPLKKCMVTTGITKSEAWKQINEIAKNTSLTREERLRRIRIIEKEAGISYEPSMPFKGNVEHLDTPADSLNENVEHLDTHADSSILENIGDAIRDFFDSLF